VYIYTILANLKHNVYISQFKTLLFVPMQVFATKQVDTAPICTVLINSIYQAYTALINLALCADAGVCGQAGGHPTHLHRAYKLKYQAYTALINLALCADAGVCGQAGGHPTHLHRAYKLKYQAYTELLNLALCADAGVCGQAGGHSAHPYCAAQPDQIRRGQAAGGAQCGQEQRERVAAGEVCLMELLVRGCCACVFWNAGRNSVNVWHLVRFVWWSCW